MPLAKKIADKYNAKSYNSIDEMLTKETTLDACLVCTPTKTHFAVAKKIMERGIMFLLKNHSPFLLESVKK